MDFRRGLWRIWIVGTALWLAFWLLATDEFNCFYGKGPWCQYWTTKDYTNAAFWLIFPPLFLIVIAFIVGWVASGFKRDR